MTIRIAKDKDVPLLENVINEHWKVNIDHSQEIKNPNAILLVAEENSILGTALMWVVEWNKTGYLVELAVSKEQQRKGIGSKIIDELVMRAKEKGLRAIIVETQPDNKVAMDFYLKKGFRLCGYNDHYYTNSPKSSHEIAIFFALDIY